MRRSYAVQPLRFDRRFIALKRQCLSAAERLFLSGLGVVLTFDAFDNKGLRTHDPVVTGCPERAYADSSKSPTAFVTY
jgi:hypothetical protein